jgi:isopenicillin N synthase-like dioxygenase
VDLDVVDFTDPQASTRFASSMRETGFGFLVNFPISTGLVRNICDEWIAFFLTDATRPYQHADGEQDGFFPAPERVETLPGGFVRDRKEFFHVFEGKSYPREVSDAALRYLREAKALALTLLGWLDSNATSDVRSRFSRPLPEMAMSSPGTVLRIQHYLPEEIPAGELRSLPHEDINLITLLPMPSEPGLQIRDRSGAWQDVPFEPSAMVVNAGEMLQLASGGYFPATPHRVANPTGIQSKGSRMSLPLFVHPAPEVELAPGRTAAAFLQERVDAMRRKGWAVVPGGKGART